VGLFDIAVVVLALGVCGSLGLLAWTLGAGSVATVKRARRQVSEARDRLASTHGRIQPTSAAIHDTLARLQGDR
jgi:hypothetical protein